MQKVAVRCCVAGGGPAGVMVGLLLARAGVDVVVLEKHADFFRDFRGDTIHPSTLELMHELGCLDELLKLPHEEAHHLSFQFGAHKRRGRRFRSREAALSLHRLHAAMGFPRFPRAARRALSHVLAEDERRGDRAHRRKWPRRRRHRDHAARAARCASRSRHRRRWPAFAGAREIGPRGRGVRRADGCAVVRPAAARDRPGRDDGPLRAGLRLHRDRSARLLAMRLCHTQGQLRRDPAARPAGLPAEAWPPSFPKWRTASRSSTIGTRSSCSRSR